MMQSQNADVTTNALSYTNTSSKANRSKDRSSPAALHKVGAAGILLPHTSQEHFPKNAEVAEHPNVATSPALDDALCNPLSKPWVREPPGQRNRDPQQIAGPQRQFLPSLAPPSIPLNGCVPLQIIVVKKNWHGRPIKHTIPWLHLNRSTLGKPYSPL
jgi:hypothetical protein